MRKICPACLEAAVARTELDMSPEDWDEDSIQAASAVVDGLEAAKRIIVAAGLKRPEWLQRWDPQLGGAVKEYQEPIPYELLFEVYDRYQQELRVPVIVQPPEEM